MPVVSLEPPSVGGVGVALFGQVRSSEGGWALFAALVGGGGGVLRGAMRVGAAAFRWGAAAAAGGTGFGVSPTTASVSCTGNGVDDVADSAEPGIEAGSTTPAASTLGALWRVAR
jgi:hypothetical protein